MQADPPDAPQRPRREGKARPWYLVAAMCLMWVFGALSAASGCSNVSYLRGSHELPESIAQLLEQSTAGNSPTHGLSHPLVRASLVREQARLEAMTTVYRRAFPLALAQLLLGLTLVVAAGAALAGRPGARELALQVVAANALLAIVGFGLYAPVRQAMAQAVAVEVVDRAGGLDASLGRDGSIAARRAELAAGEGQLLVGQLLLFGLSALALSRARTKAYFAAAEPPVAGAHEHPDA